MSTVSLLSSAIPAEERAALPETATPGVCCLTGLEGLTVARKHLLSKSFTDQAVLRAPQSDRIGVDAYVALSYKWERMSNWWCDGVTFRRLSRPEVRELVIGGVDSPRPWAGYITTSYKKHGALRAPVNQGRKQVWVFENVIVDCSDRDTLAYWWTVMGEALRGGIGRRSMESLSMPAGLVLKIGVERWEAYRAWARDKWQSRLYQLLCYLLESQDELKKEAAECFALSE